jgi:hypothetical protein
MTFPPPPAPPPRVRSRWWPPLIASSCLLVLLVAAIMVVAADKAGRHRGPAATRSSPSPSTLIDPCLVGTWRTSADSQRLDVAGVGPVEVTGSGVVVHIGPDGSDRQEYASATPYSGTANGHRLEITVRGTVRGTIRTANGTITFQDMSADGTATAAVDGAAVTSLPLTPGTDPVSYTCTGDTATERGPQYTVTLERTSRLP